MQIIVSPSHQAPFNIASEEYILDNFADDVFLLYINAPSIIVGKHQNTLAEINTDYVHEHNIPVVRRLTGGGTVFHDLGNLNFSFIMNRGADEESGFAKYTAPVLDVLQDLGVDARLEGRNDLTIEGLKFSGNAKAVYRHKIQQHGTILFSAKIADLSAALNANPLKFRDKAVKSVSRRVTNVTEHLQNPLTLAEFIDLIRNKVLSLYPDAVEYSFSVEDCQSIETLVQSKYATWEWNYGLSPRYNHVKAIRCAAGTIEFHTDVHKGLITGVRIYGDFFGNRDIGELERALVGVFHREAEILEILNKLPLDEYFGPVLPDDICGGLM
jgi:lipoate---protein ligase